MATRHCERCNRKGSMVEVGWGVCTTCNRTLCPMDIERGCDGVVPAAVTDPTMLEAHLARDSQAE
jgi:hypothetical protein